MTVDDKADAEEVPTSEVPPLKVLPLPVLQAGVSYDTRYPANES